MTQTGTRPHVSSVPRRLAGWVARLQWQLADRLFAGGDAFARKHGWKITKTTGRLGFGARMYRDPRFGQHAVAARPGESPSNPGSRAVQLRDLDGSCNHNSAHRNLASATGRS